MANYPGRGWGQSCAFSPVVFGEDGYQDPTILMASEERDSDGGVSCRRDPGVPENETWGNAYRKTGAYEKLLDPAVEEPFIRTPLTRKGGRLRCREFVMWRWEEHLAHRQGTH